MSARTVKIEASAKECAIKLLRLQEAKQSVWNSLIGYVLDGGDIEALRVECSLTEGLKRGTWSAYLSQIENAAKIGAIHEGIGQREVAAAIKEARADGRLPPAKGSKSDMPTDAPKAAEGDGFLRVRLAPGINPETVFAECDDGSLMLSEASMAATLAALGWKVTAPKVQKIAA